MLRNFPNFGDHNLQVKALPCKFSTFDFKLKSILLACFQISHTVIVCHYLPPFVDLVNFLLEKYLTWLRLETSHYWQLCIFLKRHYNHFDIQPQKMNFAGMKKKFELFVKSAEVNFLVYSLQNHGRL